MAKIYVNEEAHEIDIRRKAGGAVFRIPAKCEGCTQDLQTEVHGILRSRGGTRWVVECSGCKETYDVNR